MVQTLHARMVRCAATAMKTMRIECLWSTTNVRHPRPPLDKRLSNGVRSRYENGIESHFLRRGLDHGVATEAAILHQSTEQVRHLFGRCSFFHRTRKQMIQCEVLQFKGVVHNASVPCV